MFEQNLLVFGLYRLQSGVAKNAGHVLYLVKASSSLYVNSSLG